MKVEDFLKENVAEEKEIRYPIRKIKAYDSYVMVLLDDDKIQISDEAYFRYKIKDLRGLDEELYKTLKDEERLLKAYRGVLRKISSKDQTVKQIDDYLLKKQLNKSERGQIIDKLIDYGLLDDEKYTANRISSLEHAMYSERQIRQKLKNEGISEQLITEHLKKDDGKEFEKARVLAAKYQRSIRNKTAKMKRQAILSRLAGQGYSYEIASKAADALDLQDENEVELINKEYLKAKRRYEKKYEGYDLKNHIVSYLLSRGFDYENITKVTEE
jgi:SOS response regulatory protein OraA/RecX